MEEKVGYSSQEEDCNPVVRKSLSSISEKRKSLVSPSVRPVRQVPVILSKRQKSQEVKSQDVEMEDDNDDDDDDEAI